MLAPERVFYANSMSKTLNPTLRIGGLVVPEAKLAEAEATLQVTAIMVSPLSCAVMEQWLIDGTADTVSLAIQDESKRRMSLAKSLLGEFARIPNYSGYHLWIPLHKPEAERLYQAAAAFGILLTPPSATEVSSAVPYSGLRLCLGAPSIADLSSALTTIGRLLQDDQFKAFKLNGTLV